MSTTVNHRRASLATAAIAAIGLATAGAESGATSASAAVERVPACPASTHHAAGDIDGDGRSDLVVAGLKTVQIHYSCALAASGHVQTLTVPDGYVSSVAVADVDGHGHADLLVGDTTAYADGPAGEYDGALYVYYGGPDGFDSTPDTTLPGPSGQARSFGEQVVAGDITGDGAADVLVSSESASGLTELLGTSIGLDTADRRHVPLQRDAPMALGDVTHDGRADLVAGLPDSGRQLTDSDGGTIASEGGIRFVKGGAHGLSTHRSTVRGMAAGDGYGGFGASVTVARVDGDRYPDVVVGAPTTKVAGKRAGAVTVLFGRHAGLSAHRRQSVSVGTPGVPGAAVAGDSFGSSVSVGDVTGDGHPDLVVSALTAYYGAAGKVYVLPGTARHGLTGRHAQRITQRSAGVPGPSPAVQDNFGFSLTTFHPSGSRYAWLAIGAPEFQTSAAAYADGYVAVLRGTHHGLRLPPASVYTGTADRESLGEELGP